MSEHLKGTTPTAWTVTWIHVTYTVIRQRSDLVPDDGRTCLFQVTCKQTLEAIELLSDFLHSTCSQTHTAMLAHVSTRQMLWQLMTRLLIKQQQQTIILWPFDPGTPWSAGALTKERLTGTTTGFLWARCPSCHSTYSVKALKENSLLGLIHCWTNLMIEIILTNKIPVNYHILT